MRLSGLQKSVIALYRSCLREAQKKPYASYLGSCERPKVDVLIGCEIEFQELCEVISTHCILLFVCTSNWLTRCDRSEFKKNLNLDKKDFAAIEVRDVDRSSLYYVAPICPYYLRLHLMDMLRLSEGL